MTLVPAGQVAWVKCSIPPNVDQSYPLLFEPDKQCPSHRA